MQGDAEVMVFNRNVRSIAYTFRRTWWIAAAALVMASAGGCAPGICRGTAAFGNLGPHVNSPYNDYAPALADTATLVFTSNRIEPARSGLQGQYRPLHPSHLFFAMSLSDRWDDAQPYSLLLREERAEAGTISFAPSGSPFGTVAYVSSCTQRGAVGGCDVYAVVQGSSISLVNLGAEFNSEEWDGQPSVRSDGTRIYFASNRAGGHGGTDIWIADRLPTGSWGVPYNAGPIVNSAADELSPFYDSASDRLYFAAATPDAGLDLFVLDPGATVRRRLPRPFNSEADDFTPYVRRGMLYLASSRPGGCGGFDIYSFALAGDD